MKSYLKYIFFTSFVLLLIGCGGGTTTTDDINTNEQQSAGLRSGFSGSDSGNVSIVSPKPPASTLRVSDPVSGEVTISWNEPTMNTDDSILTDLAGYYIYYGKIDDYGKTDGVVVDVVDIQDTTGTTHTFANITASDYFFAISAYNQDGVESVKVSPASATNN